MKSILFVIGNLRVGGVSKALIELLKSIDGLYDISLLCFDTEGDFLGDVPRSVHIIPTTKLLMLTENSAGYMKKYGNVFWLLRIVLSGLTKLFGKKLSAKFVTMTFGVIPQEYDVAISYIHPMADKLFCNLTGEFVLDCVKAKKKVEFIHCDYTSYGGKSKYNDNLIKKFDSVAVVSNSVGKALISSIPEIKNKTQVVYNCHAFEEIKRKANENPLFYKHKVTFVSISRLSEEKGLARCIKLFAQLYEEGYDVGWHIVGSGPMKESLLEQIFENKAEKCVFLEGEQTNPFRYVKNADYLLVPSYHEAAPMVYDEAATLGVPTLTTNTLSAIELVQERNLGVVCANTDKSLNFEIRKIVDLYDCNVINKPQYVPSNDEAVSNFKNLCEV